MRWDGFLPEARHATARPTGDVQHGAGSDDEPGHMVNGLRSADPAHVRVRNMCRSLIPARAAGRYVPGRTGGGRLAATADAGGGHGPRSWPAGTARRGHDPSRSPDRTGGTGPITSPLRTAGALNLAGFGAAARVCMVRRLVRCSSPSECCGHPIPAAVAPGVRTY